jgi:hypothetical protein
VGKSPIKYTENLKENELKWICQPKDTKRIRNKIKESRGVT